jgi:sugar/nucleoside kinase (ribokinase family)
LTALGVRAAAAAGVGDDELASLVLDRLSTERIESSGVSRVAGVSTSYSIVIEPPGIDRSFWHHSGANDEFDGTMVDIADADILHVGYPSLLARLRTDDGASLVSLFDRARFAGVVTSLDLAVVDPASPAGSTDWGAFLAQVLPLTDVVSPSADDLRSMAGAGMPAGTVTADALAQMLVDQGAAVAMVSAGSAGMHLVTGSLDRFRRAGTALRHLTGWEETRVHCDPVPPERLVSTNGAGDAATAGLLAGIIRGVQPRDAVGLAAHSAADAIAGRFQSVSVTMGAPR